MLFPHVAELRVLARTAADLERLAERRAAAERDVSHYERVAAVAFDDVVKSAEEQ